MWGLGTGIWSMLLVHNKESESEVAQSCPTLCDQARVLESIAISFSRGSSRLRNRPRVSCIAGTIGAQ